MDQWSKTTSHQRRDSDNLQYGKLRSYRGSRLVKFFLGILSTSRTPMKQESHSSSSSSSSPSSPTVGEMSVREREDAPDSDISPVPVSELVDDRTGKPVETQANKIPKPNKKETTIEQKTRVVILRSRNRCKNSGKFWWMMKFHYIEALTPVLLMKFL